MKAAELRDLTSVEISQRIDELYQELFNLRFQAATKQLADTSRMRLVKKDIARAKTILTEIEQQAEVQ
jgi:large subunit ribosomal protein L29